MKLFNNQYDFVKEGPPAYNSNLWLHARWLDLSSGEVFVCTDDTADANVWKGHHGTQVDTYFDEYWDYVTYLYPFNEAHDATTFVDQGPQGHYFQNDTGVPKTKNTQSKWYDTSLYFPGTSYNDSLSQLYHNRELHLLADRDFTLEFWIRPNSGLTGYPSIMCNNTDATGEFNIFIASSNYGVSVKFSGQGQMGIGTATAETWTHFAIERNGSTLRGYRNGAVSNADYSNTWGVSDTEYDVVQIGSQAANYPYGGYMQDLRLTQDIARYKGQSFNPRRLVA